VSQPWGWWTSHKLQILEEYLAAFARASSGQKERIYLDLFAGWPENHDRDSHETILGSVHRALAAQPPFTRVGLFELERKAARLEATLRARYPDRAGIKVFRGDCNVTISSALAALAPVRWAPTFAFVDQFDCEVHWSTLEQISRFRPNHLSKAEMWILFGTSFYPRGLNVMQPLMNATYAEALTRMFGSEEWVEIIEARRDGALTPTGMRDELLNLMRWRLEKVLGYKSAHAFLMKKTDGQNLYHMIFVSDHAVGDRIMCHLYGRGLQQHEQMRKHALIRRRDKRHSKDHGVETLFSVEPSMIKLSDAEATKIYQPEPPRPPYTRKR